MNYYNDNDKFCVAWLKELVAEGLIPYGDIDDRPIQDILPADLKGYIQCHFFAGIGGWSRALELTAWPTDRPVWTGSCPCQPLSDAGQGGGETDERHLWPAFHNLIKECRPVCVFGEQVASKLGREWLAGVHADLEVLEYTFGAADLCAAGVGSPHIRQRLWWVAITERNRRNGATIPVCWERQEKISMSSRSSPPDRLADSECDGRRADKPRRKTKEREINGRHSFWSNSVHIPCADGKWRRVPGGVAESYGQHGYDGRYESSHVCGEQRETTELSRGQHHLEVESALFPLADGISNRVGTLRGAGNSIVAPLSAEFIKAFMEVTQ